MKAIVIGGGPAGASAALGLLRLNFEVVLFEQRTEWTGRVCGSFLNPEAVRHLNWLGVRDECLKDGAVPVHHTLVTTPGTYEILVDTGQKDIAAMTLPRKNLEKILLEAVEQRGGQIHMGTRAVGYHRENDVWHVSCRNDSGLLQIQKADLVIVADGRFTVGATRVRKPRRGWYGWNATYLHVPQKPGEQSLHLFPGGYVGVITYADGTSNVCGLIHRGRTESRKWEFVYEDVLRRSKRLNDLLLSAKRISDWHGVGPLPFSSHLQKFEEGLPVGDAAAVGDPFMGEGIGRALGAGPLLFTLLSDRSSSEKLNWIKLKRQYQNNWTQIYGSRLKIGRGMRWVLSYSFPFYLLDRLILRKKVLKAITPLFHVGFEIPASA